MDVSNLIISLTTATLPSGKFKYLLFLDKVTSLLMCSKSQPQKYISSINSSNANKHCIVNLGSEIYKQKKSFLVYKPSLKK
jgi:hypothetical protein